MSRSFADILCDKELITYFIQYMGSKDKGHLVRFWLDSENFTQASLSRMRVHSMHSAIDETSPTNNTVNMQSSADSNPSNGSNQLQANTVMEGGNTVQLHSSHVDLQESKYMYII